MAKASKNKLRTLYIMKELYEKTDIEHRMSTKEIIAMLKRYDLSGDRKSIYDDIETLREWGVDILYTKEKPEGYYIIDRSFELPELKLLVDAVQSSKFITQKKSRDLIRKIEKLASEHEAKQLQRNVYIANRIKTDNESIYYNVDKIQQGILSNCKIKFTYYQWNIKKQLVPKKNGASYIVSPWALTWDDENYYLIGFDSDAQIVKHYRVDKMREISIVSESREGEEEFDNFDIAKFAKSTFGMYGGAHEKVTLECENALIGAIIDRFGSDAMIHKQGDSHFRVCHEVAVSGQFFGWVFGLGPKVKIVSPEAVVEEFKSYMDDVYKQY